MLKQSGIVVNVLKTRFNLIMDVIVLTFGTSPVNALPYRESKTSQFILVKESGKEPFNWLFATVIFCRLVILSKVSGIGPVN